jgi:hypothetical protein
MNFNLFNSDTAVKAVCVLVLVISLYNTHTIRRIEAAQKADLELLKGKVLILATGVFENRDDLNLIL